jgi:hypothetical protein
MNRRLVALLVVLAISLQGPSLAYAAAAAAKTMPASCAGHVLGQSGSDDSCCPQGMLPGVCCAGGLVLTGMPSAPVTLPAVPLHLLPSPSGAAPFATERPSPLLRPPIA